MARVLQLLEQSSCSFVEYSELADKFGEEKEELAKDLKQLVEEGRLGRRTAFGTTLYWLKNYDSSASTPSSSRFQTPPSCPAKRPQHTPLGTGTPLAKRQHVEATGNPTAESSKSLQGELQEKREKLRKLKLVQLYNTKNNLQKLDELICKWRTVSQEAAECLLQKTCMDPRPTLGQLLQFLQVDFNLIHYSPADESFY